MKAYIARRLFLMIPVILGASFLIFSMVYALPGDPVRAIAGDRPMSPAVHAEIVDRYNLDDPLIIQYLKYMGGLVRGDMGMDFSGRPVTELLMDRLPHTFNLAIIAVIFEAVIGIIAGAWAGAHRGKWFDNSVLISTILIVSVPIVVLAFITQFVFGLQLGWFPISGVRSGPISYILPGMVLGATSLAYVARLTRTSMAENLRNDYVRTARAKGLSANTVIAKHTLRNSLIPVVTFIGADFGALMGGAVITETVFSIPGLGSLMVDSIRNQENAVVVGVVTLLVFVFIMSILVTDVLTALLDPRIRLD